MLGATRSDASSTCAFMPYADWWVGGWGIYDDDEATSAVCPWCAADSRQDKTHKKPIIKINTDTQKLKEDGAAGPMLYIAEAAAAP